MINMRILLILILCLFLIGCGQAVDLGGGFQWRKQSLSEVICKDGNIVFEAMSFEITGYYPWVYGHGDNFIFLINIKTAEVQKWSRHKLNERFAFFKKHNIDTKIMFSPDFTTLPDLTKGKSYNESKAISLKKRLKIEN
jgi:hypothetical protein